MVTVKPFSALRPQPDFAAEVACVPYDVINTVEAQELAKGKEKSFLHVVRSEIDLPDGTNPYDAKVYQQAKSNLQKFIADKVLFSEAKPCFYIYQQIMQGHSQYSIMAVCAVNDYDQDKIKKHEKTRPDKEDDRTNHIITMQCQAEPVFLAYDDSQNIDTIVQQWVKAHPRVYDFTAVDGIQHTVWVIDDDATMQKIQEKFKQTTLLYIADGHHRSASASRARAKLQKENPQHTGTENYNYFLAAIFPKNQLKILPYNRVIKDLNGLNSTQLLQKISEHFVITPTDLQSPKQQKEICMYLDGQWHLLQAKPHTYTQATAVEGLDVSILQNFVLAPLLGIEDPRTSKRIDFVGGIRGTQELIKLVDSGSHQVAFSVYPVSMQDIMDVADAGFIMPPKSTWFEPKLRSGLLVHTFVM